MNLQKATCTLDVPAITSLLPTKIDRAYHRGAFSRHGSRSAHIYDAITDFDPIKQSTSSFFTHNPHTKIEQNPADRL
jgi:hypothetical protein